MRKLIWLAVSILMISLVMAASKEVPDSWLVGNQTMHYHLNTSSDNSTAYDSFGKNNLLGSNIAATDWVVRADYGNNIDLDGANEYFYDDTTDAIGTVSAMCFWYYYRACVNGDNTLFHIQSPTLYAQCLNPTLTGPRIDGPGTDITFGGALNTWQHICITLDGVNMRYWQNGTLLQVNAYSGVLMAGGTKFYFGTDVTGGTPIDGMLDDLVIFNKTNLSEFQVSLIYNGTGFFAASSNEDNINLSAPAPTPGGSLNVSSVNINLTADATYDFNCTLYQNLTLNETKVYGAGDNVAVDFTKTFSDGSYSYQINCTQGNDTTQNESTALITFNVDTIPPAITANYTTYYTLLQPLSINSYDAHNANLTAADGCNLSYYNSTQTTTNYTKSATYDLTNCSLGSHQTNLTGCDSFRNCYSTTYTFNSMGQLNVSAYSGVTNATILNFSVIINGTAAGSTTNGTLTVKNITAGVYNVTIDSFGYALQSANVSVNSTLTKANISLYTNSSLLIRIYQEGTGLIITQNVSLRFVSPGTDDTYSTMNGTFYIDNLNVTSYTITVSNANFTTRNYIVSIGNRTFQQLDAYLPASTSSTTIFTIYDKDTFETLNETLINQYVFIAGAWVVVDSKLSDITGRAQFSYTTGTQYKFYLSRVEYDDYVFYLNPILFGTYDVKMSKTTQRNTSQDFEDIGIIYAPQVFQNNANTTFNFIIAMPTGGLVNYGLNLSYPGGSNTTAGSNALGGQMTVTAHILNAGAFDYVTLRYYYHTTIAGYRNFTVTFPIVVNISSADNSLARTGDNTYGLSIWERTLIATLILMLVVGIAALAGQPLPGILAGLLVMAFFAYVGFLPLWLVLPSCFIIVFMIIWKSGGP